MDRNSPRMLETTIDDGSQEFRLEKKVTEAAGVDRDIAGLLGGLGDSSITIGGNITTDGLGVIFLLFVVQKILLVFGHAVSGLI